MLLQELSDIFSSQGALARAVEGYRPRPAQLELANAIAQAMQDKAILIAEAGTGTGKTWAYLVPAFLSNSKVLVSTGTRTLQDQLFNRDVPRLREALALPIDVALLKGRGNYVCHYHLQRLLDDGRTLSSRAEVTQLRHIKVFAQNTLTGDRAELPDVPEDAEIWSRVTSTRENCLGQDCPFVRDCFVLKARRHAQEADLVVVNHALFMADLALREEGVTDLLPSVDMVVFDEAHQLPDIATRFLGISVSLHQLLDLARGMEAAGLAHAREARNWSEAAKAVELAARALRLAAAPIDALPGRKAVFDVLPQAVEFDEALSRLLEALDGACQSLQAVSEKHPDLMASANTCLELRARLFRWSQPDRQGRNALRAGTNEIAPDQARSSQADQQAPNETMARGRAPADAGDAAVRWVEVGGHYMRLHSAPLSVARIFSRFRRADQTWIMTSATLSVHGDFGHFQRQLGLTQAQTIRWESPFDYGSRGLLLVPETLPLPSHPDFTQKFVQILLPLIEATSGGVLVLCTTLRAVDRIAQALFEEFEQQHTDRVLLKQGDYSRRALLERFRAHNNAVLVGSTSFWEGIDVPGNALTLLAIDKLPFAPPDDPVLEARLKQCRNNGGNPFMEYQIPQAAIALKQGAGRLIRNETDWGVLLVGDQRIVDKPYGRLLWRGLPPFARTRDPAEAIVFLQKAGG